MTPLNQAFAAAVVLAAAGCASSGSNTVVQPGAPGEASRTVAAATPAGAMHTAADTRFMQGMIMHHAQALEMTALVPSRTTRADLRLMAKRIDASQVGEIAQMKRWLQSRKEAVEMPMSHDASGMHDMRMPGMLTTAQMSSLAAARDVAFDRLFLEGMIQHHEGALTMVKELLATDGAAHEPEIFQLVQGVDADQRAEIARMRTMLNGPTQRGNQ